jgi:FkbM family methyltransferase
MSQKIVEVDGLLFSCRSGTSDQKTVEEVVRRKTYLRKWFNINEGESWIDFGGNIGAFTILAISMGATVETFECDPVSCKIIEANLKLNGMNATIHQKAVGMKKGFADMSISKTGQFWRNSVKRNLGGGFIRVETIDFRDYIKPKHCVKMDIEGSEMEIVENWPFATKKLVFEWSFDVDDNIARYREVVKKLHGIYQKVSAPAIAPQHDRWKKSWFPPCKNVFCY